MVESKTKGFFLIKNIFSGRIIRPIRGAIVQMALTQSAVAHKKLSGRVQTYEFPGQEKRCLKSQQKDRKYFK